MPKYVHFDCPKCGEKLSISRTLLKKMLRATKWVKLWLIGDLKSQRIFLWDFQSKKIHQKGSEIRLVISIDTSRRIKLKSSRRNTLNIKDLIWHIKAWWYQYPTCYRKVCGNHDHDFNFCKKLELEEYIKCHKNLRNWGKWYWLSLKCESWIFLW